jgi:hypothetical protein
MTMYIKAYGGTISSTGSLPFGAWSAWGSTYFYVSIKSSSLLNMMCKSSSGAQSGIPSVSNTTTYVGVADMTGDGNVDVIVTQSTGAAVGTASPSSCGFSTVTSYNTGKSAVWATTGDFNGDTKIDIVTANGDGTITSILRP